MSHQAPGEHVMSHMITTGHVTRTGSTACIQFPIFIENQNRKKSLCHEGRV